MASSWADARNRCTRLRQGAELASEEDQYQLNVVLGKKGGGKEGWAMCCKYDSGLIKDLLTCLLLALLEQQMMGQKEAGNGWMVALGHGGERRGLGTRSRTAWR